MLFFQSPSATLLLVPLCERGTVFTRSDGGDSVLLCCFFNLPPQLRCGLTALLWGAKAPVVASNAPPRCPSLRKRDSFFVSFVLKLLLFGEEEGDRLRWRRWFSIRGFLISPAFMGTYYVPGCCSSLCNWC